MKDGEICNACSIPEHDLCPLLSGCTCCEITADGMDNEDEDEHGMPVVED